MLNPILEKLIARQNLTQNEVHQAAQAFITDEGLYKLAAFLVLLRSKGETAEEIAALISFMRQRSIDFHIDIPTVDIVGTGGDGVNTVNISTGASILAAACGVPVAKHGNRAVSSRCGSADALEALGINIEQSPEQTAKMIKNIGFGFLFAQRYHPGLKEIAYLRRSLQVPTIFNLIAPLLNPAKPPYLLYGIYEEKSVYTMACAVQRMGIKRALIFHGNGTDELVPTGVIKAFEVTQQEVFQIVIEPEELGLKKCSLNDLKGGAPQENAACLRQVFSGKTGPIANALALNAGAALWVYGKTASLKKGVEECLRALQSGQVEEFYRKMVSNG